MPPSARSSSSSPSSCRPCSATVRCWPAWPRSLPVTVLMLLLAARGGELGVPHRPAPADDRRAPRVRRRALPALRRRRRLDLLDRRPARRHRLRPRPHAARRAAHRHRSRRRPGPLRRSRQRGQQRRRPGRQPARGRRPPGRRRPEWRRLRSSPRRSRAAYRQRCRSAPGCSPPAASCRGCSSAIPSPPPSSAAPPGTEVTAGGEPAQRHTAPAGWSCAGSEGCPGTAIGHATRVTDIDEVRGSGR